MRVVRLHRPPMQDAVKLSQDESLQAVSAIAMRCGGCGAKVGATVLSRALGNLHPWSVMMW
jgi:selenide,water dikinase